MYCFLMIYTREWNGNVNTCPCAAIRKPRIPRRTLRLCIADLFYLDRMLYTNHKHRRDRFEIRLTKLARDNCVAKREWVHPVTYVQETDGKSFVRKHVCVLLIRKRETSAYRDEHWPSSSCLGGRTAERANRECKTYKIGEKRPKRRARKPFLERSSANRVRCVVYAITVLYNIQFMV